MNEKTKAPHTTEGLSEVAGEGNGDFDSPDVIREKLVELEKKMNELAKDPETRQGLGMDQTMQLIRHWRGELRKIEDNN